MSEHNHITRDVNPIGECPGCDRYHYKQLAKESWRNYDCDPVGGNCPDAVSFIPGFIEGAMYMREQLKHRDEVIKVLLGTLDFIKVDIGQPYLDVILDTQQRVKELRETK